MNPRWLIRLYRLLRRWSRFGLHAAGLAFIVEGEPSGCRGLSGVAAPPHGAQEKKKKKDAKHDGNNDETRIPCAGL